MVRYISLSLLAVALVAPVTGAPANQAAPAQPDAAAETGAPKEKMICKTEYESGSRTKKTRTCRTAAEWADLRQQTRQQIDKMQVTGSKY